MTASGQSIFDVVQTHAVTKIRCNSETTCKAFCVPLAP